MVEPKISIVVPVYNAEKYLEECLNSLLNQTFQDIEILCINDGSKDSSLDILNTFKEKDNRIKVFSQENAGPAKARNVGLEHARGEYLMFCDADDTYEPEMCEEMHRAITENNVDFAVCDTNIVVGDEDHGRDSRVNYLHIKHFGYKPLTLWMRTKINVMLWNKIFKMRLIKKYHLSFPIGYEFDDTAFIWQYLSVADSFYGLNQKLYNYRLLNNSIMGKIYAQKRTEKIYDKVYAIKHFFGFLKNNNILKSKDFFIYKIEDAIKWMRPFLDKKGQIKFLKLFKQEVLDAPEVKEALAGKEDVYPLTCACLVGNYQSILLRKKSHLFAKIIGNIKSGDKKRFYLLGIPVFKRKKTQTGKIYYVFGVKVFEKTKKKSEPQKIDCSELKTPIPIPENERYILCIDCLYDKGQEAVDAWTLFKYLQSQKIPSKYAIIKGNKLEEKIAGMPDVVVVNEYKNFYKECSDVIRKSKYIITSFGIKMDRCLKELDYLTYFYIDHGAILLKKWVFDIFNLDRYDKILASNRLTYGLYKEKGWDDSRIVCAGMPRWDLLAHKENNGHIFVFFTWRKTFQKNIEFGSRYMAYIGEFLKKLRQSIPNTSIDVALHHETLRRDINFPDLEALNIRILPTSEVSKAIRTSSMLITDYSSVFWDFIYMDKPVVFYRFDKDDMSLNQVDQEATISAMQEDKKLYNCLYEEKEVLEKVSYYVRNNFQIESEIAAKNKEIFWESRNNCENLLKLINGEK